MKHPCPVCKTPDAISTEWYTELQGDPPMTGWISGVELGHQSCSCELSDEEIETLCNADDGTDWYEESA